jgi:hypothetical protein
VELRVVADRTQVSHSHAARCRMTITAVLALEAIAEQGQPRFMCYGCFELSWLILQCH